MARQLPDDLSLLARLYERWEPQENKRRQISDDLKELFSEGKADGFNPKAMRKAFAERYRLDHQTAEQREKAEATDDETELYLSALARVRESDKDSDTDSRAKVSTGNAVNAKARHGEGGTDGSGETSRLSEGSGTLASHSQPATDPKPVVAAAAAPRGASESEIGGQERPADLATSSTESRPSVEAGEAHAPHQGDGSAGSPLAGAGSDEDRQLIQPNQPQVDSGTGAQAEPDTVESAGGENVAPSGAYEPPSNVTELRPAKKQWKHSDKAHPDCLNPSGCGGFSNLGLCPQCKEAAAGGQVA